MMSRSLFFNLQKEDMKRRLWTVIISMLGFFLALPIFIAISVENYHPMDDISYIYEDIIRTIGVRSELLILLTIIGACICGLSGFFYLHSKKQVDFYHSIPVRKECLFSIYYLNGVLIYLIPYVFNLAISLIIIQINGYMSTEVFTSALTALGFNTVFFLFIYTVVIIAVMLTGNFIVSCLGSGVLLSYGVILHLIRDTYFRNFFVSYYAGNDFASDFLIYLSPVGYYYKAVTRLADGCGTQDIIMIGIAILISVLLVIGALLLYKYRPSEAAGKAMAFQASKAIIKFLMVIPFSLGGGVLFRNISNFHSTGWLIFGLIFSLIITYAATEIIYDFDIRSAFKNKKHILLCALAVGIITCVFQFDLFKYDSFIPKKDKVSTMSIAIMGIDDQLRYFDENAGDKYAYYMDYITYQLKNMEITDFDKVYELAEMGIREHDNHSLSNLRNGYYGYYGPYETNYINYYIKYTYHSGKEVYRRYFIPLDEGYNKLRDIFADQEYKKAHYPIYELKEEELKLGYCSSMLNSKEFMLSEEDERELIRAYKEDLNQLTLDEIAEQEPVATLSFFYYDKQLEYLVYPSFAKTIDILQKRGFDATKQIDSSNVKQISITYYQMEVIEDAAGYPKETAYSVKDEEPVIYTDKNEIEEILNHIISEDYRWKQYGLLSAEEEMNVAISYKVDEFGNEGVYNAKFKLGQIPDFVKEDIGYIPYE